MSYLRAVFDRFSGESLSSEERSFYSRQIGLPRIGLEGQLKLKCSRVLVVGAGGLGCPVLQALAGAGVGHLTVMDPDSIEPTNIARQWLYSLEDAGRSKAVTAVGRIRRQNPFIEVSARVEAFGVENGTSIAESHDLVIDATDNFQTRVCIDQVCAEVGRPWIFAGLHGDSFQMALFWAEYGARFRDLFAAADGSSNCEVTGMMGTTSSLAGNWQAREAVNVITGSGTVAPGVVTSVHAVTNESVQFRIPGAKSPERFGNEEGESEEADWTLERIERACSMNKPFLLVNLREGVPAPSGILSSAESIRTDDILEDPTILPEDRTVCLVCENGVTSRLLAGAINSTTRRFPVVYLKGGFAS